jgi:hypothetical protein
LWWNDSLGGTRYDSIISAVSSDAANRKEKEFGLARKMVVALLLSKEAPGRSERYGAITG